MVPRPQCTTSHVTPTAAWAVFPGVRRVLSWLVNFLGSAPARAKLLGLKGGRTGPSGGLGYASCRREQIRIRSHLL